MMVGNRIALSMNVKQDRDKTPGILDLICVNNGSVKCGTRVSDTMYDSRIGQVWSEKRVIPENDWNERTPVF
jgi:hypothetical protein